MTDRVQIAALAASIMLLLLVLELVRRRHLAEEYSTLWILSALGLMAVSWRRDLLDTAAGHLEGAAHQGGGVGAEGLHGGLVAAGLDHEAGGGDQQAGEGGGAKTSVHGVGAGVGDGGAGRERRATPCTWRR